MLGAAGKGEHGALSEDDGALAEGFAQREPRRSGMEKRWSRGAASLAAMDVDPRPEE
jgi:hypothetical protein